MLNQYINDISKGKNVFLNKKDKFHVYAVGKEVSASRTNFESIRHTLLALKGKGKCVTVVSVKNIDNIFCRFGEKKSDGVFHEFQVSNEGEVVFPPKNLGILNSLRTSKSFLTIIYMKLKHVI